MRSEFFSWRSGSEYTHGLKLIGFVGNDGVGTIQRSLASHLHWVFDGVMDRKSECKFLLH